MATAWAVARDGDRGERFPAEVVRALAGAGLLAVNVPEALGGAAAGPAVVGEIIATYGTPDGTSATHACRPSTRARARSSGSSSRAAVPEEARGRAR